MVNIFSKKKKVRDGVLLLFKVKYSSLIELLYLTMKVQKIQNKLCKTTHELQMIYNQMLYDKNDICLNYCTTLKIIFYVKRRSIFCEKTRYFRLLLIYSSYYVFSYTNIPRFMSIGKIEVQVIGRLHVVWHTCTSMNGGSMSVVKVRPAACDAPQQCVNCHGKCDFFSKSAVLFAYLLPQPLTS